MQYNEPWEFVPARSEKETGIVPGGIPDSVKIPGEPGITPMKHARRITAAINACAGIPTELLEEGVIRKGMVDFEVMKTDNQKMQERIIELTVGYNPTEQNCKGRFGPCGRCGEATDGIDIEKWIGRIINGGTGFKAWEDRECVIFHTSREEGIAAFVIRCLGNPRCEGSKEVLSAILSRNKAEPVNATVLQALIEVTNALQDLIEVPEVKAALYADVWSPVISEARDVIEQAKDSYFPGLFIGEENGIRDIEDVSIETQMKVWMEVQRERRIATPTNPRIPTYENPPPPPPKGPDEPDYDNQAKDYGEDGRWEGSPTPYDP